MSKEKLAAIGAALNLLSDSPEILSAKSRRGGAEIQIECAAFKRLFDDFSAHGAGGFIYYTAQVSDHVRVTACEPERKEETV